MFFFSFSFGWMHSHNDSCLFTPAFLLLLFRLTVWIWNGNKTGNKCTIAFNAESRACAYTTNKWLYTKQLAVSTLQLRLWSICAESLINARFECIWMRKKQLKDFSICLIPIESKKKQLTRTHTHVHVKWFAFHCESISAQRFAFLFVSVYYIHFHLHIRDEWWLWWFTWDKCDL